MNEQDILDWLEENYDRNPDAGVLVYYREDVLEKLIKMQKRIAELEKERDALIGFPFKTYKTEAAESVTGIALRQFGNEKLWVEIARLNSLKFPDVSANDYYPVGTILIMPNTQLIEAHNLEQQAKGVSRFAKLHLSGQPFYNSLATNYCSVLLMQTKQLREGVNHE